MVSFAFEWTPLRRVTDNRAGPHSCLCHVAGSGKMIRLSARFAKPIYLDERTTIQSEGHRPDGSSVICLRFVSYGIAMMIYEDRNPGQIFPSRLRQSQQRRYHEQHNTGCQVRRWTVGRRLLTLTYWLAGLSVA